MIPILVVVCRLLLSLVSISLGSFRSQAISCRVSKAWFDFHALFVIDSFQALGTKWHASFARHQRHRWHAWWHGSHHSHRGAFGFCGLLHPWQRLPHLLRLGSWGALDNWIVHWICGAWRDVIRGSDMARFYKLIQAFKLFKCEHR